MKYPVPIKISLFDFFTKGILDMIKIGQTKEYILNNFPKSENVLDDKTYRSSIWRYSTLEFHFDKDVLFLIWCDGLAYLENTNEIVFDKWILENEICLGTMLEQLNNLALDYQVKHQNEYSTLLEIKQSGVRLHFENDETALPIHQRTLMAFGLSHPDYERPL